MKTIPTIIHRAYSGEETLHVFLDPPSTDDIDSLRHRFPEVDFGVSVETLEIPMARGFVTMWDSHSDGEEVIQVPHLHFECPRCEVIQNVDLYPDDPSPRLACCGACGWNSMVWVTWREP